MAEKKILNSDFRNGLYKSLVEAGYDKDEARIIVGKKYFVSLKENVLEELTNAVKQVETDKFDIKLDTESIKGSLQELEKMKEILSPSAKDAKKE